MCIFNELYTKMYLSLTHWQKKYEQRSIVLFQCMKKGASWGEECVFLTA